MRGRLSGLVNPHPMTDGLPAMFRENDFAVRFVDGLDDVMAPIMQVMDNIPAYLDPALAPPDFVEWLASWVGLVLDRNWPLERRRALLARAMELYKWRGTLQGLTEHVELYTGVTPEVEDSGAVTWGVAPDSPLPGSNEPTITVRVRVDGDDVVDESRLDRLVAAAKPAHVRHRVEVVRT